MQKTVTISVPQSLLSVTHFTGGVAYGCADLNLARVAGLLLVDPVPDPSAIPEAQRKQVAASLRADYEKAVTKYYRSIAGPDPAITARVLKDASTTPKDTIIGLMFAQREFQPKELADKFDGLRLSIIQSQFDVPTALHRLGKGFDSKSIDGVGHWLHLVAPEKFQNYLDEFLATVDEVEQLNRPELHQT